MTQLSSKVTEFILNLPGFEFETTEGSSQEVGRSWYYDTSAYPPRLVLQQVRRVTNCTDGSPQDVWANAWIDSEAYQHANSCPNCLDWHRLNLR